MSSEEWFETMLCSFVLLCVLAVLMAIGWWVFDPLFGSLSGEGC